MLSADDIDAFKDDFETVQEFVRRAEKGIPPDRWTTGDQGSAKLAASCKRVLSFVNIQADAMAAMHEDMQAVGLASMEAAADPMR